MAEASISFTDVNNAQLALGRYELSIVHVGK
jgi:hypothetical protein